jgi:hypothetical protein
MVTDTRVFHLTILHVLARFLRGACIVPPGNNARMILGSMVSPPCSTTSHQCLDRREPCRLVVLALGQLGDIGRGIAQGAQLAAIVQGDRIVEGVVLAFVRHQSLIRFSTRVCLCPNSGAIADIPQPPLRARAQSRCAPARCTGARAEGPVGG